jgi:hypothetical protein
MYTSAAAKARKTKPDLIGPLIVERNRDRRAAPDRPCWHKPSSHIACASAHPNPDLIERPLKNVPQVAQR